MSESSVTLPAFGGLEFGLLWLVMATAAVALLYGGWVSARVLRRSPGPVSMQQVAAAIQEGARAYLRRQFGTMSLFIIAIALALFFLYRPIFATPMLAVGIAARVSHGLPRQLRRRVRRHEPGRPRQRPDRVRRDAQLQGRVRNRVSGRDGVGDVHRRTGPPRRDDHLRGVPRRRRAGADRVRLRRLARRPVHAHRRRHLHEGGRRRRRSRRQGGSRHPRGRPAERGDDRGQRRGQRRGLRGHGGGRVRVVRGHARRRDHPRRGRAARPHVPARRTAPARRRSRSS